MRIDLLTIEDRAILRETIGLDLKALRAVEALELDSYAREREVVMIKAQLAELHRINERREAQIRNAVGSLGFNVGA